MIAAAGNSGRANEYPVLRSSYPAAHNWVLGVEARKSIYKHGDRRNFPL